MSDYTGHAQACVGIPPHDADMLAVGTLAEQRLMAALYCEDCPVRQMCLEAGMGLRQRGHIPHGVWGGLTRPERLRLLSGGKPSATTREVSRQIKYRGVFADRDESGTRIWVCKTQYKSGYRVLGTFPYTPDGAREAAELYDAVSYALRGRNAKLNFPDTVRSLPRPDLTQFDLLEHRHKPYSPYRGVQWVAGYRSGVTNRTARWRAVLPRKGSRFKYLGVFPATPEGEVEAARTHDAAYFAATGLTDKLNFPEEYTKEGAA